MEIIDWTADYFMANENNCLNVLKQSENWCKVPLLNHIPLHEVKDGSIVRFRGMIQDMQDPECYLMKYEVKSKDGALRTVDGRYRDILQLKPEESINQESVNQQYGERRTMFIISIPGINKWAHEIEKNNQVSLKNKIEFSSPNLMKKRPLNDDEEMDTSELVNSFKKPTVIPSSSQKTPARNAVLSSEYLLNSPIPNRPSKACLVKTYENFEEHSLNSLVDIIGFLSVDPVLDGTNDVIDDFDDEMSEHQATYPPPSLIPRIHAISVKKMNHSNPILELENTISYMSEEEISKDINNLLSQCLFGDKIAAQYLFCHLISTVYVRNDLQSLGQFSINLSNIPSEVLPEYTTLLYEIIEILLPVSHYFPMTLENMNTMQFVPKKDYKTNKLTSGLLQLAPHTHLILDETRLQTGKLESNGVNAIASIAHLINNQKLKYNFEFYQLEFNTDVPVLILSEGKSMLPNNCHIPIIPETDAVKLITETIKAGKHFIQQKLNQMRSFLTKMKTQKFDMNTEDPEMIEKDFVHMRKECDMNADDLHGLLVLSRLLGLTKGKSMLDRESWELAKDLEHERKNRLEMFCKNKNEM